MKICFLQLEEKEIFFQQDGVPTNFRNVVFVALNEMFQFVWLGEVTLFYKLLDPWIYAP